MASINPEFCSEFLNYFIPYPSQAYINSAMQTKIAPFLMTCIVAYYLKALLESSVTNHLSSWPQEHNILHYFLLPFEKLNKYSRLLVDPQNIPAILQLISFL